MKIEYVRINNWSEPGSDWWNEVENRGDEQLIDASIRVKLSYNEYRELLDKDKQDRDSETTS